MTGSASALLLRDFVNTYDVECDADEFGVPADLAGWLTARGLVPSGTMADEADLMLAHTLRDGLRAAMLDHHGPTAAPSAELNKALAALPLRVSLDGRVPLPLRGSLGGPALVPVRGGIRGGLAVIAGAVVTSAADGDWQRLKVCREATCQWAFLDTSKNRSRSWCSMRVCGNRAKTRAYRVRHRDDVPGGALGSKGDRRPGA